MIINGKEEQIATPITVAELIEYEAMGLAKVGEGYKVVREGITGDVCDGVERLTGRRARPLELTLRDRGLADAH